MKSLRLKVYCIYIYICKVQQNVCCVNVFMSENALVGALVVATATQTAVVVVDIGDG